MIKKILSWIKNWFWREPTKELPKEKYHIPATEVLHDFVCIKYKDQWINLRKGEVELWNRLNRKDRRAMALKTAALVKKGKIRFERINGKMTCIKNLDYESRIGKDSR